MSNVVTVQALRDIDLPQPLKKDEIRDFTKQDARALHAMKLVIVVTPKKRAAKQ